MNREKMERGIREFLEGLVDSEPGIEHRDELLAQTPGRVTRAFSEELLAGYAVDVEQILQPMKVQGAHGAVVLNGVGFTSVCAHHLLPYRGVAHVGFIPARDHVGLGALARVIDALARRLTFQEALTAAVADAIHSALEPESLVVSLQAEHACLAARGARKQGHELWTLERRGEPNADLDRLVRTPTTR